MTKWVLFQHSPPLRFTHFFHMCCSAWLTFVKRFHPVSQLSYQQRICHHHCDTGSNQFSFHIREQIIVRWNKIKRMGRIIIQFKATITQSRYWNKELKQDPFRQFYWSFGLDSFLYMPRKVGIVFSIDGVALLTKRHWFFFGASERVFHCMDYHFVSDSKWRRIHPFWDEKHSRTPAGSTAKNVR